MDTSETEPDDIEVAGVLNAMANLMAAFRQSDLALQDALSSMAAIARSTTEMHDLQHIDLITQTHEDLSRLLPVLAAALEHESVDRSILKRALTLRSLQDKLLHVDRIPDPANQPGELSLF